MGPILAQAMELFMRCHPVRSSTIAVALIAALVVACAHTGPRSPAAKPVLYPNDAYNRLGPEQAQAQAEACGGKAQEAGLSPRLDDNAVGRNAAEGAAVGGAVGAVRGIFSGRLDKTAEHAAKGAAIGGTAGAVHGAFHNDKPNPTYRHFVARCLKEQGLEVIGWN